MFGGVRRKSSNVRAMQLFHELKQQFPTFSDHAVSTCIANQISQQQQHEKSESLPRESRAEDHRPEKGPAGRAPPELIDIFPRIRANEIPDDEPRTRPREPEAEGPRCGSPQPSTTNIQGCDKRQSRGAPRASSSSERNRLDMNQSGGVSDLSSGECSGVLYNKETETAQAELFERQVGNSSFFVKRPDTLDLLTVGGRSFNNIQPSGRCNDVPRLLSCNAGKPPKSPLAAKRLAGSARNSPTKGDNAPLHFDAGKSSPAGDSPTHPKKTDQKRETAETPTQTTDTLLEGSPSGGGGSVNLSLKVNCSMDLVQSPTRPKCSTSLQVTPQQPWCQDVVSPRSYTSVNLTLRPPSSEPQPPIDITSQNSSLTYSTSSFDPQKGLQSRLQITVGPGGGGVSSMRTRPNSYHQESDGDDGTVSKTALLPNLSNKQTAIVERQQARLEKMKIELRTEKVKLVSLKEEVARLEQGQTATIVQNAKAELVNLQKEIEELRGQCDKLTIEVDTRYGYMVPLGETDEMFYDNVRLRDRGPINLGFPTERFSGNNRAGAFVRNPPHQQPVRQSADFEDSKWDCHMCTFQNHPLLDKCEQCEMPRILHGKREDLGPGVSPPYVNRRDPVSVLATQYRGQNGGIIDQRNTRFVQGEPRSLLAQLSSPADIAWRIDQPSVLAAHYHSDRLGPNGVLTQTLVYDRSNSNIYNPNGGIYNQPLNFNPS